MVNRLEQGAGLAPTTVAEAAALLRADVREVVFEGGGTKQWPPHDPSSTPATVSTASLTGIVMHDPVDGVAIVRAGTPLAELQAELATHGQWLAIDPPFTGQGATVGGIFSANDAGPRRLAYGTLRDLVIGATVVTGDGIVAHSGGRVIKNVAGFDIARLYCGAFGTLGLVGELALRLHPLRPASRTVAVVSPRKMVLEATRAVRSSGLTPTALDWRWDMAEAPIDGSPPASEGTILVRFEERTERAGAAQVADFLEVCERLRIEATMMDHEDEQAAWTDVDGILAGSPGDTVVRAVTRPSLTVEAARLLRELAAEAEVECSWVSHALVGVHTACLRGAGHGSVFSSWRSEIEQLGGHATVRRFGAEPGDPGDRWGTPPRAVALMRRVKQELDPHNRCAPGSFVGGI